MSADGGSAATRYYGVGGTAVAMRVMTHAIDLVDNRFRMKTWIPRNAWGEIPHRTYRLMEGQYGRAGWGVRRAGGIITGLRSIQIISTYV